MEILSRYPIIIEGVSLRLFRFIRSVWFPYYNHAISKNIYGIVPDVQSIVWVIIILYDRV